MKAEIIGHGKKGFLHQHLLPVTGNPTILSCRVEALNFLTEALPDNKVAVFGDCNVFLCFCFEKMDEKDEYRTISLKQSFGEVVSLKTVSDVAQVEKHETEIQVRLSSQPICNIHLRENVSSDTFPKSLFKVFSNEPREKNFVLDVSGEIAVDLVSHKTESPGVLEPVLQPLEETVPVLKATSLEPVFQQEEAITRPWRRPRPSSSLGGRPQEMPFAQGVEGFPAITVTKGTDIQLVPVQGIGTGVPENVELVNQMGHLAAYLPPGSHVVSFSSKALPEELWVVEGRSKPERPSGIVTKQKQLPENSLKPGGG